AIILAPVMIGLELTLRHILRAAAVVDAVERVDPDIHYHAHLQMVKRENVDGAWVRGFRGRVPQRDKTTGLRVVCLGGSTTFGTGVEPEQAWPTLLEKTLRAEGFDVEVINAGFPWYATADSVVNYSLLMRYYHPDVVVVMHGINDLCRSFPRANEPPLEWDYGSYQGPMRSVWDTVRRRRMNRDDRGGVGAWLRALATYRFVCAATGIDRMYYSALRSPRRIQPPAPDGWSPMPSPMAGPVDSERDVGVEAFGSIEPFAAHLNYLVELCQRDGCRVVLGTQAHIYGRPPERDQPQPRHFIRLLACHLPDGSLASPRSLGLAMDAIRAATVEVAERQQLPLADVDSAIASNANLLLDDFHLSIEGNAIAADVFAEQLRPILDSIR
ncbi:MAG: hypothetical protein GY842_11675, partial [bacterium]|nr:hypothetical protein [bacterium]